MKSRFAPPLSMAAVMYAAARGDGRPSEPMKTHPFPSDAPKQSHDGAQIPPAAARMQHAWPPVSNDSQPSCPFPLPPGPPIPSLWHCYDQLTIPSGPFAPFVPKDMSEPASCVAGQPGWPACTCVAGQPGWPACTGMKCGPATFPCDLQPSGPCGVDACCWPLKGSESWETPKLTPGVWVPQFSGIFAPALKAIAYADKRMQDAEEVEFVDVAVVRAMVGTEPWLPHLASPMLLLLVRPKVEELRMGHSPFTAASRSLLLSLGPLDPEHLGPTGRRPAIPGKISNYPFIWIKTFDLTIPKALQVPCSVSQGPVKSVRLAQFWPPSKAGAGGSPISTTALNAMVMDWSDAGARLSFALSQPYAIVGAQLLGGGRVAANAVFRVEVLS